MMNGDERRTKSGGEVTLDLPVTAIRPTCGSASGRPAPPAREIVIGMDYEDMSTIADDTIGGDRGYFLDNGRAGVQGARNNPSRIDCLIITPEKLKFSAGADDDTEPESPGPTSPNNRQIGSPNKKGRSEEDNERSNRLKRIMIIPAIVGLVLLAAVGILSFTLYQMRSNDNDKSAAEANNENIFSPEDFDYSKLKTSNPTSVRVPVTNPVPVSSPVSETQPSPSPTRLRSTRSPSPQDAAITSPPTALRAPIPTAASPSAQTEAPVSSTGQPGVVQSSSPPTTATDCSSSISSQKTCYLEGEQIGIDLRNCDPFENDLVALYPDIPNQSLAFHNSYFWTRSCGETSCTANVSNGFITFADMAPSRIGYIPWPYPASVYRLYLIRVNQEGAITIFAESSVFQIDETSCPGGQ
jgi:hypothetical protein